MYFATDTHRLTQTFCSDDLSEQKLQLLCENIVMKDIDINKLTYEINGAVFEVNRVLGAGFLEKVYELYSP